MEAIKRFNLTILIRFNECCFFVDSKWIDMINTRSSNAHIANDVMIINKVDVSKQGNYGCQVHNGIEPSLWAKFFVQVLGNTGLN